MAPRKVFSQKHHETIVEAILKGNSRTNAFALTGFHPDTVFEWLRFAKQDPEKFPQYVKLQEDIDHAEALVESEKVALIKQAADNGTWQAAAWWLERRKPKDWGRNDTVKHDVPAIPQQQVNVLILEDPNAREASRELLNRLAHGRTDLAIGSGSLREPSEES